MKFYWYIVEFGIVKEGNEIKVFGVGFLFSFGELKYMWVGMDGFMFEFVEFDLFKKMFKMSYKDGYQKRYFLCESFVDVVVKFRVYFRSILKFEVQFIKFGDMLIWF